MNNFVTIPREFNIYEGRKCGVFVVQLLSICVLFLSMLMQYDGPYALIYKLYIHCFVQFIFHTLKCCVFEVVN